MSEVLLEQLVLLDCLVDLDLRDPQVLLERRGHLYVFFSLALPFFIVFCFIIHFSWVFVFSSFRVRKGPRVLPAVMVSRVLLVCLALPVLKALQERMVTRSDSRTHPSQSVLPQHSFPVSITTTNAGARFTSHHRCGFGGRCLKPQLSLVPVSGF